MLTIEGKQMRHSEELEDFNKLAGFISSGFLADEILLILYKIKNKTAILQKTYALPDSTYKDVMFDGRFIYTVRVTGGAGDIIDQFAIIDGTLHKVKAYSTSSTVSGITSNGKDLII